MQTLIKRLHVFLNFKKDVFRGPFLDHNHDDGENESTFA